MTVAHRLIQQALLEKVFFKPEREIKDCQNPLEHLPPGEVFRRHRFLPATVMILVTVLADSLKFKCQRNCPLPPTLQVCCFLRFLATGSFQLVIADTVAVSQSSVSRVCHNVADKLILHFKELITFPTDMREIKEAFRRVAGFPNVIGCVNGTHIRIRKPSQNEADYVNRIEFHLLNVQEDTTDLYWETLATLAGHTSLHHT